MSEGKFKIVDEGQTQLGVHIFDPNGDEITDRVVAYTIRRRVGEMPKLIIELIKPEVECEILEAHTEMQVSDSDEKTSLADEYRYAKG